MRFRSTRNASPALRVSDAMLKGLAPDGGLYVREGFRGFGVEDCDGLDG